MKMCLCTKKITNDKSAYGMTTINRQIAIEEGTIMKKSPCLVLNVNIAGNRYITKRLDVHETTYTCTEGLCFTNSLLSITATYIPVGPRQYRYEVVFS
jgi:hypothetical protein